MTTVEEPTVEQTDPAGRLNLADLAETITWAVDTLLSISLAQLRDSDRGRINATVRALTDMGRKVHAARVGR